MPEATDAPGRAASPDHPLEQGSLGSAAASRPPLDHAQAALSAKAPYQTRLQDDGRAASLKAPLEQGNAAASQSAVLEAASVLSVERRHDSVTALTLSAPRIAAAAKPGQFVHVQVPDPTSVLRRPLGIFEADAAAGTISLLFQHVGSGTKALAGVAAGDSLSLLGPLGRGWNPGGAKRALLAGGGLGAVPLLMLARELVECGAAVSAVLGAANAGLLVAEREFSATGGLDLHIATDDGSLGHHGFVTGPVGELLAQREYDYLAACGPEPMMRAVAALSGKAAASSSDAASSASSASSPAGIVCEVSLERRMACGVGACLSCVVNTSSGLKRACVDGPVFLAGELPW